MLTYHPIPAASDSIKSATYVNGSLSLGSMNDRWRDNVYSLQAGLHRGHALGNARINYGGSVAIGSYNLSSDSYNYNYLSPAVYDEGAKFFGTYGLFAGISAAKRMGKRGEWRFIGAEGSYYKEFGDYYTLRKSLPDSAADEIDRKNYIGSLGINTEFIFKTRRMVESGVKIAFGSYLRRLYYNGDINNSNYYYHYDDLLYLSTTYHITIKKNTGWIKFNLATHAAHFQLGYNFRL